MAMSAHLKLVLDELGLTAQSVIEDASRFALAGLPAAVLRANGQVINRDPQPNDPAHAHVLGLKSKSVQKALATAAAWVIAPPANLP